MNDDGAGVFEGPVEGLPHRRNSSGPGRTAVVVESRACTPGTGTGPERLEVEGLSVVEEVLRVELLSWLVLH